MPDKKLTSTNLQEIYHCIKNESTKLAYCPHSMKI